MDLLTCLKTELSDWIEKKKIQLGDMVKILGLKESIQKSWKRKEWKKYVMEMLTKRLLV